MGDIEMSECDFCKEVKPVERTYLRPSNYNRPTDWHEKNLHNEGNYFIIIRTCSDCGVPKI